MSAYETHCITMVINTFDLCLRICKMDVEAAFYRDSCRCLWQMLWTVLGLPDPAECLAEVQSLQGTAQSFQKHSGEMLLKVCVRMIFLGSGQCQDVGLNTFELCS